MVVMAECNRALRFLDRHSGRHKQREEKLLNR
jgi:hypothetical protein